MSPLEIFLSFAIVFFASISGWYKLTEKARHDVFSKKLEAYHSLNKAASKLFHIRIKFFIPKENIPDGFEISPLEFLATSDKFNECAFENSMFISSSVLKRIQAFSDPRASGLTKSCKAFHALSNEMSKELKLDTIHKANEGMFVLPGISLNEIKDISEKIKNKGRQKSTEQNRVPKS